MHITSILHYRSQIFMFWFISYCLGYITTYSFPGPWSLVSETLATACFKRSDDLTKVGHVFKGSIDHLYYMLRVPKFLTVSEILATSCYHGHELGKVAHYKFCLNMCKLIHGQELKISSQYHYNWNITIVFWERVHYQLLYKMVILFHGQDLKI